MTTTLRTRKYGTSALVIPPANSTNITLDENSSAWLGAVELDRFYHAGGGVRQASAYRVYLCWDESILYILAFCEEGADEFHAAVHTPALGPHGLLRIKSAPGHNAEAALMVLHPEEPGSDEKRDNLVMEERGPCPVEWVHTDSGWKALIRLEWDAFLGGRPQEAFGLQLMFCRYDTELNMTPYPLDHYINYTREFYDPYMCMEVYLGKSAQTVRGQESLVTLPSGIRRWQRPAILELPSMQEREQITELQAALSSGHRTQPGNLAERVHLAQIWQDLLTLEGFDFFYNMQASYPCELVEPWRARYMVNAALSRRDDQAACDGLDLFLRFLNTMTRWWFADGTPGNLRESAWSELDMLHSYRLERDGVVLSFRAAGAEGVRNLALVLTFPALGGVRLMGADSGYFQPGPLYPPKCELLANGGILLTQEETEIEVVVGRDWEIVIRSTQSVSPVIRLRRGDLRVLMEGEKLRAWDAALPLKQDEQVYGFGERFDALSQRGRCLTLWQRDAWEGVFAGIRNQSYKNIPLAISTAGYGLFWNTSYRLRADVGSAQADQLRLTAHGAVFDWYLWPSGPREVLNSYTALTGRPLLPPRWVFGLWAGGGVGRWKNGPRQNAELEMMDVMERFEQEDIPHTALYAEGAGPDEALYSRMASQDVKVLTWDFSVTSPASAQQHLPQVSEEELPLVKVECEELFPVLAHYTDFTHPHAAELYRNRWQPRLDAGAAGTMVDFGDLIPDQAIFHDGRRGDEMHNFYYYDYTRAYMEMFRERRGDDFVLFQRGAAAGSQAFAACFAGDHPSNFIGLQSVLRGGLNLAASGFPFWGSDIGGYHGHPTEEVYVRWLELGAFSPMMRFHGTSPREPWIYSEEITALYRRYAWMRMNLLPYSYSEAVIAHRTGMPIMQAMALAFPHCPELLSCDDQYMYGSQLLVAPVVTAGEDKQVLLPLGEWICFRNGRAYQGPSSLVITVPLSVIPVFLKTGAVVPLQVGPSLELGQSMSEGKLKAWALTPPHEAVNYRCWTEAEAFDEVQLVPAPQGFVVRISEAAPTRILFIYGGDQTVRGVMMDGEPLLRLVSHAEVQDRAGWYDTGEHTIVHLPQSAGSEIRITMGNHA